MALVFFSGFETGDFSEWGGSSGSVSVVDTIKKTGGYAMRCNPSATTGFSWESVGTGKRITVYLYIASAPDAETIIIGSTSSVNVGLTDDLYLKLYDATTLKDTGSTQLLTDTQYRLCLSFDNGNDSAKIYLNGSEECSSVDVTGAVFVYGAIGAYTTVSADLYFDNYATDDTDSTDDLGDIQVLRASPNAAGQYAEFDTVTGYGNCDEVPASDVDYVDDSGVSVIHRETYNLQDSTTIGVGASDTVKAVNVWIRGYDSGNSAQGITVRDDGTDYETEALFGKAFTWKNKLYDTNAPRASAWTPAIFTAFQSGGYSEGSKDVWMSCVMVMVAYTPVGVTDYPISLSPGLTVSATVAYAVAWDRGMSPGLTATLVIARALAYDRGTSPGLTVSATIAKSLGRLITTTANLTVSSTVARFMTYTRAATSNLTASATVAKSFGKKIATTANLVVSTTIAMSKGFVRAVIPNLTASATVSKAVAYKRATTPGLTVSATIARIIAYHIATQSALSVAVSIVKSFGRIITTSPGLTASVTVVKSWGRAIATSPGLTVSATISRVVAYKRAVSSGLTTAVTIAKSFGKMITTASNLAVSVTVSRVVAYKRATQPALSVAVSVARSFGRTITTTANLVVSVAVIAVKESGIRLARAWGIIFG